MHDEQRGANKFAHVEGVSPDIWETESQVVCVFCDITNCLNHQNTSQLLRGWGRGSVCVMAHTTRSERRA